MKILPLVQVELCSAYEETHENAKAFVSDGNEIRLTATVGDGHREAVVGCLLLSNRPIDFSRSRKIKHLLMVVNASKAAVVESKCSPVQPAYGELASLAPRIGPALARRQQRGVYYPSEQLRIAIAGVLPPISGGSGGATPRKPEREATCVPLRYSSSERWRRPSLVERFSQELLTDVSL